MIGGSARTALDFVLMEERGTWCVRTALASPDRATAGTALVADSTSLGRPVMAAQAAARP